MKANQFRYEGCYHWRGRDYEVSVRSQPEGPTWLLIKPKEAREEFDAYRCEFAEFVTSEQFGGPENVIWIEKWGSRYQRVEFFDRKERRINPHLEDSEIEKVLKAEAQHLIEFATRIQNVTREELTQVFESEVHWTQPVPRSDVDHSR